MASMHGSIRGRSVTARLALRRNDPVFPVVLAPLWAWWRAAWEGILPNDILEAALRGATKAMETSGHLKHSAVEGGAGAFLSALDRVRWKLLGPRRFSLANGTSFELGRDGDPKMAMRLATRDLVNITCAESDLADTLTSLSVPDGYHRASSAASGHIPIGLLPGQAEVAQRMWWGEYVHDEGRLIPWLKPALDAMKALARSSVSESCTASFASLIEGGWWPQARLCHAGLAEDPLCRICGAEPGTIWHRVRCRLRRKEGEKDEKIQEIGMQRWWDPLFSRGIPALPLLPPLPLDQTWSFPEDADKHLVTGKVFTDGALRGAHPEARRAGWAFAMVEEDSFRLQAAFFGVCGEPWLTVLRSELHAIEQAIRRAVPPLTVYTDSASAVHAHSKGPKYCCSAKADGADIWSRIWTMLSDFGEFRLVKVKAHTTSADVEEGLISAHLQAGNAAADHFAVEARKAAEMSSPIARFEVHYARARAWYKAVVASIANWENDTLADGEQTHGDQRDDTAPRPAGARPRRHDIWEWGQAWICRQCGKSFHAHCHPEKLSKAACRGPMHSRLLVAMGALPAVSFDCYTSQEIAGQGGRRWRRPGEEEEEEEVPGETAVPPPTTAGMVRRRLVGKQPDPHATIGSGTPAVVRERESGHILVKAGKYTFCDRCGRWAIDRFGPGLVRRCTGTVDTSVGAYRVRRDRLRAGRHPLTNQPF